MGVQVKVEDITSISLSLLYAAYLLRSKKATIFPAGKAIFTYVDLLSGPSSQDLLLLPAHKFFDCEIYVDVLLRDLSLYWDHVPGALQEQSSCGHSSSWSIFPKPHSLLVPACGPGSPERQDHRSSTSIHGHQLSFRPNDCCSNHLPTHLVPHRLPFRPDRGTKSRPSPSGSPDTRTKPQSHGNQGHTEHGKSQNQSSISANTSTTTQGHYKGKEAIRGAGVFRVVPAKSQGSEQPQPTVMTTDAVETEGLLARFGCFIGKFDPDLTECSGTRKWWQELRSLLKPCKHLKGHLSVFFTEAQLKDMKATLRGVIVNGSPDHGREVQAWRKCFVIIYPEFEPIIHLLNPYAGQTLLSDGRDPRRVSQQLKSQHLNPRMQVANYADTAKAGPSRSAQASGSQRSTSSATSTKMLDPTAVPFRPASTRPAVAPFREPSVPNHLLAPHQPDWNDQNMQPYLPLSDAATHQPWPQQVQQRGPIAPHPNQRHAVFAANTDYRQPQMPRGYSRMHDASARTANGSQFTPARDPPQVSEISPSTTMTPSLLDDGQTSHTSFELEIQHSPRLPAQPVLRGPDQYLITGIHDPFGPPLKPGSGTAELNRDIEQAEYEIYEEALSKSIPSLPDEVLEDALNSHCSSSSRSGSDDAWMAQLINFPDSPEVHHIEAARVPASDTISTARPSQIFSGPSIFVASRQPVRSNKRPREDTPPGESFF